MLGFLASLVAGALWRGPSGMSLSKCVIGVGVMKALSS